MQNVPQIISFSKFLDARGSLFSIEFLSIPFSPKRLFFTNVNNELIKRGGHLHLTCHQLLFSLRGNITVNTIFEKKEQNYLIREFQDGLLIPPNVWSEQIFTTGNEILGVLASEPFDEQDYIYEKLSPEYNNS
jgi:hypothetical protein